MLRYYEYCSNCKGIRVMGVSISLRKTVGAEGIPKEILVRNYHCQTCDTFVSSVFEGETETAELAAFFELEPSAPSI